MPTPAAPSRACHPSQSPSSSVVPLSSSAVPSQIADDDSVLTAGRRRISAVGVGGPPAAPAESPAAGGCLSTGRAAGRWTGDAERTVAGTPTRRRGIASRTPRRTAVGQPTLPWQHIARLLQRCSRAGTPGATGDLHPPSRHIPFIRAPWLGRCTAGSCTAGVGGYDLLLWTSAVWSEAVRKKDATAHSGVRWRPPGAAAPEILGNSLSCLSGSGVGRRSNYRGECADCISGGGPHQTWGKRGQL
jgi:hypothetical protein